MLVPRSALSCREPVDSANERGWGCRYGRRRRTLAPRPVDNPTVPDFDFAALPAPRFAVLDVVRISYDGDPELSDDLGTVDEIRYYRDRGYRYGVDHDELGGILDEAMLAPTGQRDTIDSFWHSPLRKGDVVEISAKYPKPKWHGYFATVEHCYEGDADSYGVAISVGTERKGGGITMKYRDIQARYLIPTGDRIPPAPVPRPATLWLANGHKGLRPMWEFSIIDDVDQYL